MNTPKELTINCEPGDLVKWKSFTAEFIGILKEFDNGTAIVTLLDGKQKAVRCI